MGSSAIATTALLGVEARKVTVEVDIASGLPKCLIVGLPDAAINESRERIRAAIKNSGLPYPRTHVTVNLAPADLRKQGPSYDLAIAIGMLAAHGYFAETEKLRELLFLGELALDGKVRPVRGVLLSAMLAAKEGFRGIVVAPENVAEATLAGIPVYTAESLLGVTLLCSEESPQACATSTPADLAAPRSNDDDLKNIRGQEHAKRALEICAAGGHNLLFAGPPGSGKTMLARALPTILPDLTFTEAMEITMVHSVAGTLDRVCGLVRERPFRSPHHTSSGTALVGGGTWPRPGEVSLAHRGVLFLDEFPEFSKTALENLRQPLEDGIVTIARAAGTLEFPARIMLVAAMNPCPCGYRYDTRQACVCTPAQIVKYQQRLSGPLLDRIDIICDVPRVDVAKLTDVAEGECSSTVRTRVQEARDRQHARAELLGAPTNAELRGERLRRACNLDNTATDFLKHAIDRLHLSARGYTRILRVARTIADLSGDDTVTMTHLAEALQYRPRAVTN